MAILTFEVKGQTLTVKSSIGRIVENSVNYLTYDVVTDWNREDVSENLIISHGSNVEMVLQDAQSTEKIILPAYIKSPGFQASVIGTRKLEEHDNNNKYCIKNKKCTCPSGVHDNTNTECPKNKPCTCIDTRITTNPVFISVSPSGEVEGNTIAEENFTQSFVDLVTSNFNTLQNDVKDLKNKKLNIDTFDNIIGSKADKFALNAHVGNKVTSVEENKTSDDKYPTAKATYDFVKNVENELRKEIYELTDLEALPITNRKITWDGDSWSGESERYQCTLISVFSEDIGKELTVFPGETYAEIAFLKSYTAGQIKPDYVENTSLITITTTSNKTYIVPDGTSLIYVSRTATDSDLTPSGLILNGYDYCKNNSQNIQQLNKDVQIIPQLDKTVQRLNKNIQNKEYSSEDFQPGYRILEQGWAPGGYWIANKELLKIKKGERITFKDSKNRNIIVQMRIIDSEDWFSPGIKILEKSTLKNGDVYYFENDGYLDIQMAEKDSVSESAGNKTIDPSIIDDGLSVVVLLDEGRENKLNVVQGQVEKLKLKSGILNNLNKISLSPTHKYIPTIIDDSGPESKWKSPNLSDLSVISPEDSSWTQALSCTNEMSIQSTNDSYNLIDNCLVVRLCINYLNVGDSICLDMGTDLNNYVRYELMRGSLTTPLKAWRDITVPYRAYVYSRGNVDFKEIKYFRLYKYNSAGNNINNINWDVQYIGIRPQELQRGMVTFTFDDGYTSQYTGIKILADKGITSTLYHIAEATGEEGFLSVSELKELVDYCNADIEVHGDVKGEDGTSNKGYNYLTDEELREYWSFSQKFLQDNKLSNGRHASYPGNYHDNRVVELAKEFFDSCRTIQYYIPHETYPAGDSYRLRALSGVGGGIKVDTIKRYIDYATQSNSWLILTFHRIGEVPQGQEANKSMYCSEQELAEIADYAIDSGALIKNMAEIYNTPSVTEQVSDNASNALKKQVFGKWGEIISVDDVSPLEHEVKVTIPKFKALKEGLYNQNYTPGSDPVIDGDKTIYRTIEFDPDEYVCFQFSKTVRITRLYTSETVKTIGVDLGTDRFNLREKLFEEKVVLDDNESIKGFSFRMESGPNANWEKDTVIKAEKADGIVDYFTDISFIEGKTIFTAGKNLFNEKFKIPDGINKDVYRRAELYLPKGTYTCSSSCPLYYQGQSDNISWITWGNSERNFMVNEEGLVYMNVRDNTSPNTFWSDDILLQIETGDTATNYESYKGAMYVINQEGIVENIKSISPFMQIYSDHEGLPFSLEYNQDINKAYAELQSNYGDLQSNYNKLKTAIENLGGKIE